MKLKTVNVFFPFLSFDFFKISDFLKAKDVFFLLEKSTKKMKGIVQSRGEFYL